MAKTLGRFAWLRMKSRTDANESRKESRSLTAKDTITAAAVMRGRLETIVEAETETEIEEEEEEEEEAEEEKELENITSGTPRRSLSRCTSDSNISLLKRSVSLKLEPCQSLCKGRGWVFRLRLIRVRLRKLVITRFATAGDSYVRFMNDFATKAHTSSSSSSASRLHY